MQNDICRIEIGGNSLCGPIALPVMYIVHVNTSVRLHLYSANRM